MSMTEAEALRKCEELKRKADQLGRDHAAAQSRLTTLREEYTLKMGQLKIFGITDPKQIQGVLDQYEVELSDLLEQIEAGVPAEFKR